MMTDTFGFSDLVALTCQNVYMQSSSEETLVLGIVMRQPYLLGIKVLQ